MVDNLSTYQMDFPQWVLHRLLVIMAVRMATTIRVAQFKITSADVHPSLSDTLKVIPTPVRLKVVMLPE
jgi:hypothetical protein